ncbi:MAG: hypothetical protein U1E89_18555 [Burkholderiaceae bacterium]
MVSRAVHTGDRALFHRLLELCHMPWLGLPAQRIEAGMRRAQRLRTVALQFEAALQGVPARLANPLCARIRRAPTVTDLWHLRPAVFEALAVSLGQDQAQLRLQPLNALFRSQGPRSVPLPFDSEL